MKTYVIPIAVEVRSEADVDLILCSIVEHRGVASAAALHPGQHSRGSCVWRTVARCLRGLPRDERD